MILIYVPLLKKVCHFGCIKLRDFIVIFFFHSTWIFIWIWFWWWRRTFGSRSLVTAFPALLSFTSSVILGFIETGLGLETLKRFYRLTRLVNYFFWCLGIGNTEERVAVRRVMGRSMKGRMRVILIKVVSVLMLVKMFSSASVMSSSETSSPSLIANLILLVGGIKPWHLTIFPILLVNTSLNSWLILISLIILLLPLIRVWLLTIIVGSILNFLFLLTKLTVFLPSSILLFFFLG